MNYCKVLNLIFLLISFGLFSQSNILNSSTPDQIGKKNIDQPQSDQDSFLEYNFIDDRDILWSKIVYEKIDLDEKLNFPLLFPVDDNLYENNRKSLWRVLRDNIINKNITEIYKANNSNFKSENKLRFTAADSIIQLIKEASPGKFKADVISSKDITGYEIKGMWYFDKKISELRYRLLGILPIGRNVAKKGAKDKERVTRFFWIWYPSIRELLHKEKVYNDKNAATSITFDQLLVARRFNAYIYKEDNMYEDRAIKDYKKAGLESILESERIKKEILDFEQDMWNR